MKDRKLIILFSINWGNLQFIDEGKRRMPSVNLAQRTWMKLHSVGMNEWVSLVRSLRWWSKLCLRGNGNGMRNMPKYTYHHFLQIDNWKLVSFLKIKTWTRTEIQCKSNIFRIKRGNTCRVENHPENVNILPSRWKIAPITKKSNKRNGNVWIKLFPQPPQWKLSQYLMKIRKIVWAEKIYFISRNLICSTKPLQIFQYQFCVGIGCAWLMVGCRSGGGRSRSDALWTAFDVRRVKWWNSKAKVNIKQAEEFAMGRMKAQSVLDFYFLENLISGEFSEA